MNNGHDQIRNTKHIEPNTPTSVKTKCPPLFIYKVSLMTVSAVHCPLKNRQLQCNVDAPNNGIVKMQRYGNNIKTTGPCVHPGCIFDSLQTKQNVEECVLCDGRQFSGLNCTLMVFPAISFISDLLVFSISADFLTKIPILRKNLQ